MKNLSEFERLAGAGNEEKKSEKMKWAAVTLLILMLVQGIFTARFWRLQSEQAVVIEQLQTTLERTQGELLDSLDDQVTLNEQISAFEDQFGDMKELLLVNKVELAIKALDGEIVVFKHPEFESLFFFTDVSASKPSIWSYDVQDDTQYAESGEIDILASRKTLLNQTTGSPIEFVRVDRNRLVFLQDSQSAQAGACYSQWLSENLFAVDISGRDKDKTRYRPDAELLEQERVKQITCQKGA